MIVETRRAHGRGVVAGVALLLAIGLVSCGGGGATDDAGKVATEAAPLPEETRPHDARTFSADTASTTFDPLAPVAGEAVDVRSTSRWAGVLGGAMYRIEVPANWNGSLVMYAHGYEGTGTPLQLTNPIIRRHLVQKGYAWAASSYSRNYYDVRSGVEDTNALAQAFVRLAASHGRTLAEPKRRYIIGHSMGGHVAGAAVEAETLATARTKVVYHGAVPMCGVMGDVELVRYFTALQTSAQAIAGRADHPLGRWGEIRGEVKDRLFNSFPALPRSAGQRYLSVVKHLSGGERPLFWLGSQVGGTLESAWEFFGTDGTLDGILTRSILDNTGMRYLIDGDEIGSAALAAAVQKIGPPDPDANRLRRDGLRWVPRLQGQIQVPVLTLHTLGDLFVPFSMQQVYRQRVESQGTGRWLVQRAIRGVSHCDFTVAEQVEAFDAMVAWEQSGVRPAGDDVLDAATLRAGIYGCSFTRNGTGPDDREAVRTARKLIKATNDDCP